MRPEQVTAFKSMQAVFSGEDLVEVTHIPSGRRYYLISTTVREHDLVLCVTYTSGDGVRWSRPLADILYGVNWGWKPTENAALKQLSDLLGEFGGKRSGVEVPRG